MHKNISSLVSLRTMVYTKIKSFIYFIAVATLPLNLTGQQCSPDLLQGRDLVRNGDFSQRYSDWTYTADSDGLPNANPKGYIVFDPPTTQNYSVPGFIYAGSDVRVFNSGGFTTNFNDHTPGSTDNYMLMVDGVCEPGIKLWSQNNMPISANTRYYFSVWIHALKNGNTPSGSLQFEIQIGTDVFSLSTTAITAPVDLADGWRQFEAEWDSPIGLPTGTLGSISIENTTTTGCDSYVDFAIDDISFIPGCKYAEATTSLTPDLGIDQTICGKGGAPITLNVIDDGIADVGGNQIWWSDNVGNGTGGAGSGEFTRTINPSAASLPYTIAVCTQVGTGCKKTDVITISGDYDVELNDLTLCSPPSATLDAGFSGTGVTYQWYFESNGTAGWQETDTILGSRSKTLFVNTKGNYRVVVNDPACGIREAEAEIKSTAPTPKNEYFCNPGNVTLSVTPVNAGKYKWWNHPTATAAANLRQKGGNTYTFAASGTSDYTLYVQDTTSFVATVTPAYSTTSFTNPSNDGIEGIYFTSLQANFKITGVTLVPYVYNTNPISVDFDLIDVDNGNVVVESYKTTPVAPNGLQQNPFPDSYKVDFTTPINVPTTGRYLLKRTGGNNLPQFDGASWPYTYPAIISLTGNTTGDASKKNKFPAFFSWVISAGTPCDRVPVQAIYNCTLANTLLDFSVSSSANDANIVWTALEDAQSSHYEVQKSLDGINFLSIAHIKAKAQSMPNTYSYIDHGLESGNTYYRLAQYDKSGLVNYSRIESASYQSADIQVYPNPTKDRFTVSFKNVADASIKLDLRNVYGASVYTENILPEDLGSTHEIDMSHLPKGIYVLSVQGTENTFLKIQKE